MNPFARKNRGRHRKAADPTIDVVPEADDATDEQPRDKGRQSRRPQLRIQAMHRNLLVDDAGTWAYFFLGPKSWLCIDDDERNAAFSSFAHRLAYFTGSRIRFRGTSSPFDSNGWARALDEAHPAPAPGEERQPGDRTRLPDVEGAESFEDMMVKGQIRQQELGARAHAVAFAVRITERRLKETELVKIASTSPMAENEGVLDAIRRTLVSTTKEVAKPGMEGRSLDADELAWLIHASAGMGAPVPPVLIRGNRDGYWKSQVPGFTASVRATADDFAESTTVRTIRGAETFTNEVVVLHGVDNDPIDLDDRGRMPFLAWVQTLDYPVEFVCEFDLVPGRDRKASSERQRRVAKNIEEHYLEHDDDPPAAVLRGIVDARRIEDEVSNGDRVVSARADGYMLFAVTGLDKQDAADVADDLIATASEQQGMTLVKAFGQYASYRAFIPGEPMPFDVGLDTQMSLAMLAASYPHASNEAGDEVGAFIGPVAGGHSIFLLDPVGGSRNNKSNVIGIIADQGGGKSTLGGYQLYWNARLGNRAVGNDPSGMWKALVDIPSIDGRHLDLFDCKPGTLTPSLLVPEPRPGHYETVEEHEAACRAAEQERMSLTIDALRNLIPHLMLQSGIGGQIVNAIREAVTDVGGAYGMNPWDVVHKLRGQDDVGAQTARMLESAAKLRGGTLIFPPLFGETDGDYISGLMEQATLTIVTMKGISATAKSNTDRASWNEDQQQAVPLLDLAARFATRVVYSDKNPKCVANDEIGLTGGVGGGSFSQFLSRVQVDSRKWNALILLLGQNPGMFYKLAPEIANLLGQVWVGRLKKNVAQAALPMLGLEPGYRYEDIMTHLNPGQFLVRTWQDEHPVVTVDQETWDPAVLAALETNPYADDESRAHRRRMGVSL